MVSRNPPFGESEIRPCRKGDPMYDDNEPISLSIDYEFLSVLGACYEGLKEFNRVFPEGVTFDWTAETVALLEQIFPCDYCLNPISCYQRTTDEVWTRPYLHYLGRYICLACATTVAGFRVEYQPTAAQYTQTVSLN